MIYLKEAQIDLRHLFNRIKISTMINVFMLLAIDHHTKKRKNKFLLCVSKSKYHLGPATISFVLLASKESKNVEKHTTIIIFMGTNLLRKCRGKRLLYSL